MEQKLHEKFWEISEDVKWYHIVRTIADIIPLQLQPETPKRSDENDEDFSAKARTLYDMWLMMQHENEANIRAEARAEGSYYPSFNERSFELSNSRYR